MSSDPLEALSKQLSHTKVTGDGVSFVGKSLKLNDANDAKVVTDAIAACKNLEYLNLEGNTLGVEAAKAIGNALSSHPELKRALWKDMFTGRMKDEIPQALRLLASGLEIANVRLVELDLSDNAFGPIGMEGLASLLKSSSCYSLQVLRLNNNGLGITGAKLLSKALIGCYEKSKTLGNPLPLRVFIAGRNRLENEGITALAKVFKVLGSLEEIQIPQNGIYHIGIRELSEALKMNQGLRVLNLNDNTLGSKGSTALASALPNLQLLRHINLGDCLLRTAGALSVAAGLQPRHTNLEELLLDHNEIKKEGGLAIAKAMANKINLKTLSMGGNQFGEDGINLIKQEMKKYKQTDVLGSFSEDEGDDDDDDDDEDEDEDEDDDEEEEEDYEEEEDDEENESAVNKTEQMNESKNRQNRNDSVPVESTMLNLLKKVTVADFLQFPSPERFLALEPNRTQKLLNEVNEAKSGDSNAYLKRFVISIMKVSSLSTEPSVSQAALECSNALYIELFNWAQAQNNLPYVNNSLLVHLGLIKNEYKKWRPNYNQEACRTALKHAMAQNFLPPSSRDTFSLFLNKKPIVLDTIIIS